MRAQANLLSLLDQFCEIVCGCDCQPQILFRLGVASEQAGPIVKTPQFFAPRDYEENLIMDFSMTSSQQNRLTVDPASVKDKKGNPATIDGVPEWSTNNTEVLALEPDADGMSCLVKAVGPLGPASVTFRADGKAGPDVKELVGNVGVTIVPGDAVSVEIGAGTPEEQPE
jgi:hypothetical protein